MPEVDQELLDDATREAVGFFSYVNPAHENRKKWLMTQKLSGITRGQWKRMQLRWKREAVKSLRVSNLTIKKLKIMRDHGKSVHLSTLLKMAEAQEANDE